MSSNHDLTTERNSVERISQDSRYADGLNTYMVKYTFEVLSRYMRGAAILELGPAEGVMTEFLHQAATELTVVEGSELFCRDLEERFASAVVVNSLFEEFQPDRKFDTIVMGHVLEHVLDPVEILKRAKNWLNPGGIVFAAVPNARSLHRQAAVAMGLLETESSLNEADIHHGHRRVFDPESFRSAFYSAGLSVDVFGGYWLKPLSNAQLESWTDDMISAFMFLGERYPDIAGELYVVASARPGHRGALSK